MTNLVGILCGDKIFKKAISYALVMVILSGLFLSSFVNVYAQGPAGGPIPGGGGAPTGNGLDYYLGGGASYGGTGSPRPSTDPITGSDTDAGAGCTGGGGCDSGVTQTQELPMVQTGEIADPILAALHAVVVSGLGWVVGQFGSLFDYAVTEFIIGFGDKYLNYNLGDTIDDLWSTVRDIFNLTFIFGLVYIGFKMILDTSDSSARKMLVYLIGAALLVNFSLFITKFVVDFSNIAAFQIYRAFSGSGTGGTFSLTDSFMNLMEIKTILEVSYVNSGPGGYQYIIGLLIVFLVLAYVFLAGAIMIIIRFVVLNIYMVFSPMMFLGWVFPAMRGYSTKYWSGFLSQAFFAPAFMFMLYLSYRVADSYQFSEKSFGHLFNGGDVVTSTAGSVSTTIPYFAMVIVFLCASMVVAKNFGATGASMAMSFSGKIVGGATAGVAARVGRTAIGGSASALTNNRTFQRFAANSYVGKQLYRATSNVADRSFDARQVGGVGKKLGIGDGKKGGFNTRAKESAALDKKIQDSFAKGSLDDLEKNPAVRKAKANVLALENKVANETDALIKEQYQAKLDEARKELDVVKKANESKHIYATQLKYIEAAERWQKTQKALVGKMATAGVALTAGLATGGVAPAIAAGVAFAMVGKGLTQHTKKDVDTMRKNYGKDGSKKKTTEAQEANLKKLMELAPKDDKGGDKGGDKH